MDSQSSHRPASSRWISSLRLPLAWLTAFVADQDNGGARGRLR
ncbi:hypothetical protein [Salinispora mooreana]|nr:hypothetical protein [Salinispora mooreana]